MVSFYFTSILIIPNAALRSILRSSYKSTNALSTFLETISYYMHDYQQSWTFSIEQKLLDRLSMRASESYLLLLLAPDLGNKLCFLLSVCNQEWHQATEELVAGRRSGHQLCHPSKCELHLHISTQGSDRVLHVLSLDWNAPSSRWLRSNKCLSEASNPRSLPNSWWRFHSAHRWLV